LIAQLNRLGGDDRDAVMEALETDQTVCIECLTDSPTGEAVPAAEVCLF